MKQRKRMIIIGISAVIVLIVGTVAVVANRDDPTPVAATNDPLIAVNDPTGVDGTSGTTTTTTSGEPSATASTTIVVDDKETKNPVERTFRAPVRCSETGAPETGGLPGDSPNAGKKWETVQSLSGGCDLTSPTFRLRGIDTRLVWRSDSPSFSAFLIDAKRSDAAAGFADADCFGPCANFQSLTNQVGDYTLRVQADRGPWQVLVQEYR